MKIVNACYERINDKEFSSPLKKIERIARICYKSEDKITEDSYKKMTKLLMDRQHLAMFEHASLAFEVDEITYESVENAVDAITTMTNAHEHAEIVNLCRIHKTRTWLNEYDERFIISANIRAFYEFFKKTVDFQVHNDHLACLYWKVNDKIDCLFDIPEYGTHTITEHIKEVEDFSKLTDNERLIHETFTVVFTCDRGVTHELVRMRDSSFAQESTRYCNYQLGKFGNEITVIKPCFWDEDSKKFKTWKFSCEVSEYMYFTLLNRCSTPGSKKCITFICQSRHCFDNKLI